MGLSSQVAMVEPAELAEQLAGADDTLLLVQVSSEQAFEQAHLPGAIVVTPAELVCGVPPATGRLPALDALEQLFARIGYDRGQDIVVYDDEGGGWAGRFAWTLDVIGHAGWTYLNGGLHAWHGAGLPLEHGPGRQRSATAVSLDINTAPIAEIEDVLAAIDDPAQIIWDVRSAEEYAGLRQSAARVGPVPGAINMDWLLLQDPQREYRLIENLETRLDELGITGADTIITHCQTHHRSGLSYMVGRLLGLPVRAYHGSWSEWGNREDTPIELPQ